MRQLLSDQLNWDTYYSHNTSGEHTNRVYGHELGINKLRKRTGAEAIDRLDISEYAFDGGYEFVADSEGILRAYVLAKRQPGGNYAIDDLRVDPQSQGKGLGRFVLGKLSTQSEYSRYGSMNGASCLVVSPTMENSSPILMEWLGSRGFHKTDTSNTPALLLPGQVIFNVSIDDLGQAKEKMPPNWDGCLEIIDDRHENGGWTEVFRNGSLIGTITQLADKEPEITEDAQGLQTWHRYDFEFVSGLHETGIFTNENFATIAMLNYKYGKST